MNQQEYTKVIDNVATGAVLAYQKHGLGKLTNEEYYNTIKAMVELAVLVLCPEVKDEGRKLGDTYTEDGRTYKIVKHICECGNEHEVEDIVHDDNK